MLGWFQGQSRWRFVMRLRGDTWVHGPTAPMGGEVQCSLLTILHLQQLLCC